MFANCIKYNNDDPDTNPYRKEGIRQKVIFRKLFDDMINQLELPSEMESTVAIAAKADTPTKKRSSNKVQHRTPFGIKRKRKSNASPSALAKKRKQNYSILHIAGPVCQQIRNSHSPASSGSTKKIIWHLPESVSIKKKSGYIL